MDPAAQVIKAPTRPVLRWHGGKWKLAPWIISNFPPHRVYVEPFGGAASVLLRKPRSYGEIYNDLDSDVVNLFRVLQRPLEASRLVQLLRLTPFAREEFTLAYDPAAEPIELARRLVIRSFMGMGSVSNSIGSKATGFRSNSKRIGTLPAHDWAGYPDCLVAVIERLAGVIIESRPAAALVRQHDSSDTLWYFDPPYLPETRAQNGRAGTGYVAYAEELSADDHSLLLDQLLTLKGMVVLSGYPAPLYDAALEGWRREEKMAHADGAAERTEVLWINPACAAALDKVRSQQDLFRIATRRQGAEEG